MLEVEGGAAGVPALEEQEVEEEVGITVAVVAERAKKSC